MTGFLSPDLLRTHEASLNRRDELKARDVSARPQLIAVWTIASIGALTCQWRTNDGTGMGPSG
jgi:hypothetical protein